MGFEIVGGIIEIEIIATGTGVRIASQLWKRYGKGRWRKLKGTAKVRLSDGMLRLAEVHWFECARHRKKEDEDQAIPRLRRMAKRRNSHPQLALCIRTDDPDLLTPRMIYRVLPDASGTRSRFLRVIDNEGEDYLYPADYFMLVDLPAAVERALSQAS